MYEDFKIIGLKIILTSHFCHVVFTKDILTKFLFQRYMTCPDMVEGAEILGQLLMLHLDMFKTDRLTKSLLEFLYIIPFTIVLGLYCTSVHSVLLL